MTTFFDKLFTRYPIKTRRFLEILPGFFAWMLILFPVWGSLFIPTVVAYFILFFDVYWCYKSFSLVFTSYVASRKIRLAAKQDWNSLAKEFENFEKITHVVIIPNYTETVSKLRETIATLANQTFSTKKIYVVLAMEARETDAKEKAETLINEFKDVFGGILASFHPDIAGEVKGKSSNQAFGARLAYKEWVESGKIDLDFATISSVDADSFFDKQYYAYLACKFLANPNRHNTFWQSANVNHSNFWKVPAPVRVLSFFGSLWRTGILMHGDRLVTNSTYSLSFHLLYEIGFWDTDVIPEDYRVFFKAFYMLKGKVWVEPLFIKTSMDAPHSTSYFKTLKNKYDQERRWSWGVSDDPLFIKWWLTVPNVPFVRKTVMLFNVLLEHFLWPVNWFIITIAANIIPFLNPVFSRTTLGYNLPKLAGLILTSCLFALLSMIVIDFTNRPRNMGNSKVREFMFPLEFVLLPVIGFFLSTLPALISHTQLMFGKRLEYKVTDKL